MSLSPLVFRAGCGIRLYRFLIIAFSSTLRIDLTDWEDDSAYAQYKLFEIGHAKETYELFVSGYSGDAGAVCILIVKNQKQSLIMLIRNSLNLRLVFYFSSLYSVFIILMSKMWKNINEIINIFLKVIFKLDFHM